MDQLVLIARAAEVWSWIDNIDAVSDQIRVADHVGDETIRDSIRAVAEAGDDASLDALLGNGADPRALHGERLYRYGAEGSPEVSEFLRFEVGPALGVSPEKAAGMIGDVLDLRHRLPGLWAQLEADRVGGWVACKVARMTRNAELSPEVCAELDRRIAPYAPGWTANKILTQTEKLIVTLDPESAEARRRQALARRYVAFWADRHPSGEGMLNVRAQLDAVPAADLEATLNALADVFAVVEPDRSRDELRACALQHLAHPIRAAAILAGDLTSILSPDDLLTPNPTQGGSEATEAESSGAAGAPAEVGPSGAVEAFVKPDTPKLSLGRIWPPQCATCASGTAPSGREVTLVIHVNPADVIRGAGGEEARLGTMVRTLLDELIGDASRNGRVRVKPFIDPMAVSVSDSETPPPTMAERVKFRSPSVAFPYSDRAATGRGVDIDHTIPRPHGPTTEPNLAPLDRRAHRAKTHAGFRTVQIRNGTLIWSTPAGQKFTVTPHGTYPNDPGPGVPTMPPYRPPAEQARDLINRARKAYDRAAQPEPARPSRPEPPHWPAAPSPSRDEPDDNPPPF